MGGDSINKRQKEILQAQLDNEKAVLKKLEANYQDALDEINSKIELLMARQDADMQHVIYQVQYQQALKTQVQSILETLQTNEFETLSEYLTHSYEDGFVGTMYDLQGQGIPLIFPLDQAQIVDAIQNESKLSASLYAALGHDVKDLQKKIAGEISRGIAGGQMYTEIARNVSNWARIPKNNAMRIARTEAHRIQCKAAMDAQHRAKEKGADVVKQWDASLDKRTRDSHRDVDGEIRELDEPFSNGLKYPGDPSGRPEEVINCRCALLQRARWALGNDYTKWSPDAEVVIDDDGTTQFAIIEAKNYKDFQKQYKQASERVRESAQKINDEDVLENTVKRSKIKSKWDNDLTPRGQLPHIDEDDLYSYVANELNISEDKAIEYVDSVLAYSENYYSDIKRYQTGRKLKYYEVDEIKAISDSMEDYIQKAPRWNGGETFRGWKVSDEQLIEYKEGAIIDMGGTSSWSGKENVARDFATRNLTYERPNSVIFHCPTQEKGTGIRHIAVFETEDEILCSMESRYKITQVSKDDDGIIHVFTEEVNE